MDSSFPSIYYGLMEDLPPWGPQTNYYDGRYNIYKIPSLRTTNKLYYWSMSVIIKLLRDKRRNKLLINFLNGFLRSDQHQDLWRNSCQTCIFFSLILRQRFLRRFLFAWNCAVVQMAPLSFTASKIGLKTADLGYFVLLTQNCQEIHFRRL